MKSGSSRPEAPLAAGVTDYFAGSDIRVFGPSRAGATKLWSHAGCNGGIPNSHPDISVTDFSAVKLL